MQLKSLVGLCLLAFASISWAEYIPQNHFLWGENRMGKLVRRATTVTSSSTAPATSTSSVASSSSVRVADASCTNGPLSRACWGNGYSIATDFDQKSPTTGNTVTYSLEITNTTCNPDGNGAKLCMLINGAYPGPTIRAKWGDQLVINVKNSLQDNGTSIHWHGIRQLGSSGSDGVGGITECPIAPGDSKQYSFRCTQYGTSWYHSHFSSQYGEGIFGTIVIDGPASSNYDIDLGVYPITDWYYKPALQVNMEAFHNLQNQAPPPNADNMLINGTNMNAAKTAGKYSQVTLTPGKKHRLRLINTSVDNFISIALDGHNMTVMTADFIPIQPLVIQSGQWLQMAIGMRYDVVINANQGSGNFWFRANVNTACSSGNNNNALAIFTYSGTTVADPTTTNTSPSGCNDQTGLIPYWKQAVPSDTFNSQVKELSLVLNREQVTTNGANLVVWALNTTMINVAWDKPTMQYLFDKNTSYPSTYSMIELPTQGIWTYWVVQEVAARSPPIPHPIHLHGHDFFVLGSGTGTADLSTISGSLNFANPPRRDTASLPGGGWLALAFETNNPGAWLMHCHIAWHISEGLGVQFLEAKDSITMPDQTAFSNTCSKWKSFEANMPYAKEDSGL
ncbi:laccase, multicopper oxidase, benzenediol:oxygen oxidorectuctase [Elasticomyces elasticus]|nr:laccase, multicopper oxidase, benzenediol:oxygen oxidorectuctase [Elasticomyces elasticus]